MIDLQTCKTYKEALTLCFIYCNYFLTLTSEGFHIFVIIYLDPDPPTIISVEYLSESRAKITWKATRCNFANVKKINIQQAGSGVLSYTETNWDNQTEIGYQIVENITVVANQTYFWNVSIVYGEGVEEATSQSSPVFEAAVAGKFSTISG